MTTELPKAYSAQDHEPGVTKAWDDSGYANPDKLPGQRSEPYSISLPPPNATGVLHMGHAVMVAIQDLLIRFERMRGKKALWLPGTDHAAIATQSVVEKQLNKEKKRKEDLGREKFLKRVNDYVQESQGTIKKQIRALGASLDWSRERFTLDKGLSDAVAEAFVQLYTLGLVYRGQRIVNWDPKMQSNVSDDEIEWIEQKTPFYYFQYGPFTIGTARPETKFGDKYVVVHPKDKRYAKFKDGEQLEVEWITGTITATVIKDEAVDMEFGTGAMTITPWHDATDFEIAERHNLDREQIIDFKGKLLPVAGAFAGEHITKARPKIVEQLKKKGLLVKVDEDYVNRVATNYRGGGILEPQVRDQWFIDVDKEFPLHHSEIEGLKKGQRITLKQLMKHVVESGQIRIVPDRFTKMYYHWIDNLRDWNISRQIWYGHRIPAWWKGVTVKVQKESPGNDWEQDPDTLDTWFSSGLWTFSTLGWPCSAKASQGKPRNCEDLKTYHPTSVMETGYDILFFWVARMILMSTTLTGQLPFKTVYLHGLVRDRKGRKMSKSLNNGIDPLKMTEKYGADAVRLSLLIGTTPGNDQRLYEEKIAGYRNYANKIWNIGRFVLMNTTDESDGEYIEAKTVADKWIHTRKRQVADEVTRHIEQFEFSLAGEKLYDFLWHEFADWYVEIAKVQGDFRHARKVLTSSLKLLHPFMPFVTEALWKYFRKDDADLLMIQQWPTYSEWNEYPESIGAFQKLQERIIALRKERTDAGITGKAVFDVTVPKNDIALQHREVVERLASVRLST